MNNLVRSLTNEGAARSSSKERAYTTGRGGAGNMESKRRGSFTPDDLKTPTLKAPTYTTGRGGTGNMAKNDPDRPELARASQDVEAPIVREHDREFHFGRGGAGNNAKLSEDEVHAAKESNRRKSQELQRRRTDEDVRGWADKGKDLLGKLGAKK